jgi:predicted RNA-binding Zn-ribbon protein involved in translation (DUF1610 family)
MKERYAIREPSADILALLSVHGQTYEISDSEWNRLTWEDIAHAIADIKNDGARWLGRIYVLQEFRYAGSLTDYLADDLMRRRRVRKPTPRLTVVCALALHNFIEYPWCPSCNGAEKIQEEKVIGKFTCPDCGGIRTKTKPTARELAGALEIPLSGWQYIWGPRYEEAWNTLERLFDIVNGGIAWRAKSLKSID